MPCDRALAPVSFPTSARSLFELIFADDAAGFKRQFHRSQGHKAVTVSEWFPLTARRGRRMCFYTLPEAMKTGMVGTRVIELETYEFTQSGVLVVHAEVHPEPPYGEVFTIKIKTVITSCNAAYTSAESLCGGTEKGFARGAAKDDAKREAGEAAEVVGAGEGGTTPRGGSGGGCCEVVVTLSASLKERVWGVTGMVEDALATKVQQLQTQWINLCSAHVALLQLGVGTPVTVAPTRSASERAARAEAAVEAAAGAAAGAAAKDATNAAAEAVVACNDAVRSNVRGQVRGEARKGYGGLRSPREATALRRSRVRIAPAPARAPPALHAGEAPGSRALRDAMAPPAIRRRQRFDIERADDDDDEGDSEGEDFTVRRGERGGGSSGGGDGGGGGGGGSSSSDRNSWGAPSGKRGRKTRRSPAISSHVAHTEEDLAAWIHPTGVRVATTTTGECESFSQFDSLPLTHTFFRPRTRSRRVATTTADSPINPGGTIFRVRRGAPLSMRGGKWLSRGARRKRRSWIAYVLAALAGAALVGWLLARSGRSAIDWDDFWTAPVSE